MLADRQQIRQHLRRMILVGQAVPNWYARVFCQLLHNLLSKATVFNPVIHPAKHSRRILNTLLLPNLRTTWIKVGSSHSHIVCRHLEGASGSSACLLENKGDIHSSVIVNWHAVFLLFLQICRQIQKIGNLLWCIIL